MCGVVVVLVLVLVVVVVVCVFVCVCVCVCVGVGVCGMWSVCVSVCVCVHRHGNICGLNHKPQPLLLLLQLSFSFQAFDAFSFQPDTQQREGRKLILAVWYKSRIGKTCSNTIRCVCVHRHGNTCGLNHKPQPLLILLQLSFNFQAFDAFSFQLVGQDETRDSKGGPQRADTCRVV